MMVDPDVPSGPGTKTSELLHWMQSDLVSASNTTMIAGQLVYQLINPNNASAIASYIQPSPPQKNPLSHRYVQILLNTTDPASKATLAKFGATRGMFNASNAVAQAALQPLAGNSFNVTFNDGNGKAAVESSAMRTIAALPSFTGTMGRSTSPSMPLSGASNTLQTWGSLLGVVFAGMAALF